MSSNITAIQEVQKEIENQIASITQFDQEKSDEQADSEVTSLKFLTDCSTNGSIWTIW